MCLFNKPTSIRIFFSNSDLSASYLVFKTNPLVLILPAFQLIYHKQSFQQHNFLLYHLVCLNQQEQLLFCQYLFYLLQFLDWLNLFLMQKTWSINVRDIFHIWFCGIIRQINFYINISSKISEFFRKVLTHFILHHFYQFNYLILSIWHIIHFPSF